MPLEQHSNESLNTDSQYRDNFLKHSKINLKTLNDTVKSINSKHEPLTEARKQDIINMFPKADRFESETFESKIFETQDGYYLEDIRPESEIVNENNKTNSLNPETDIDIDGSNIIDLRPQLSKAA